MTQNAAKDFFISYNKFDRAWAEWIAWQLEAKGYTTVIQAWDFQVGSNFVLNMQQAASSARRTLLVLSPEYLASLYTQPEWAAAFVQDPTGRAGTLIPVRVRPCELSGLLSAIVYLNLVNLDESEARSALLAGVRGTRSKPTSAPNYPGGVPRTGAAVPRFPGNNETFRGNDEVPARAQGQDGSTLTLVQPAPHVPREQSPIVSLAHTIPTEIKGRMISPARKLIIVLLVVLILLSIGGGVYVWRVNSSHAVLGAITATSTAAGTTSMSSYDIDVSLHGIMFGFDAQHTRTNPYESILDLDNVSQLQPKWSFPTGNKIDSSAPAVANSVIYVGSQDHNLYAIDAATGKKKWVAATGKAINSSPAVADGVVYVGSDDGNLYAFVAATGDKKWTFSTGSVIDSSPAVANGMVYVGSQDKIFYAIDVRTGRQKWTALTGAIHDSSPAVANGVVYVGSWQDHKLHAFDAATGEKKWATSTGDAIYSSPVVANGVVYVGSFDGKLYAFDATTGEKKWAASTENSIVCSPAVANGVVYVGSWDHKLYAFSRR